MTHLDIPELRSRNRAVSQWFGRFLHNEGYGGIIFHSAIPPGGDCVALFEGRGRLEPAGKPRSLTRRLPALTEVCREFGLGLG